MNDPLLRRLGACLRFFLLTLVILSVAGGATAQEPAKKPATTGDPKIAAVDALGRETPKGTLQGFLRAAAEENYALAAKYLDISALPEAQRDMRGPVLALQLQRILDANGSVKATWRLNDDPLGDRDDRLAPELDRIGSITIGERTVDFLVERVEQKDAPAIWLISKATVAHIPDMVQAVVPGPMDSVLPKLLSNKRLSGVPIGHWLASFAIAAMAYLAAWLLTALVTWLTRRIFRRVRGEQLRIVLHAAIPPVRLFLSVWIFVVALLALGISVLARQYFGRAAEIVALFSIAWLAWRTAEAFAQIGIDRIKRRGGVGALSAVVLARRAMKFALVVLVVIGSLDTLGVDVTAGIAALGIGGIAIALGAQKTIENFVGSLTLIIDRPIQVGDFCRFGETKGTIEDVGMRSTRIRTLDRTLVTIPNGQFSSIEIENYTRRDRFWLHPTLGLRYETTPDQIRYLIVELRAMLYAHPRVEQDPARVRFLGFGNDSLNVEIFAYVRASGNDDFLEVQEDINLRIMDIVEASGASFAFQSRTIYIAKDPRADDKKRTDVEEAVKRWTSSGDLRIPRFSPDQIAKLRNTLDYPSIGSTARKKDNGV